MEDKIRIKGKIAEFPKNSRADDALKILETIKVNPKKIWYVLIESQDNELKMVKYNIKNGFDLYAYTNSLKSYYLETYGNSELLEKLNDIEVIGEDNYSVIRNIPEITLEDGSTLIGKITQDLIITLNS